MGGVHEPNMRELQIALDAVLWEIAGVPLWEFGGIYASILRLHKGSVLVR